MIETQAISYNQFYALQPRMRKTRMNTLDYKYVKQQDCD
jgi:hypothetical protein